MPSATCRWCAGGVGGRSPLPELQRVARTSAEQIIELMRSWKGQLPDVQVVDWEVVGAKVVARLHQPPFGDDADWFQVSRCWMA